MPSSDVSLSPKTPEGTLHSPAVTRSRNFIDLPLELRRQIYCDAMRLKEDVMECGPSGVMPIDDYFMSEKWDVVPIRSAHSPPPSLLAVSKEARAECLPLYYSDSYFGLWISNPTDLEKAYKWAAGLTDEVAGFITKLVVTIESLHSRVPNIVMDIRLSATEYLRFDDPRNLPESEEFWGPLSRMWSKEEVLVRRHIRSYFRRGTQKLWVAKKQRPVLTAVAMGQMLRHLESVANTDPVSVVQYGCQDCVEEICGYCSFDMDSMVADFEALLSTST